MSCTLCESDLGSTNVAVLDCGHTFHLSCVFKNAQQFTVICAMCDTDKGLMCDLGDDRTVAMKADLVAKCRKRQLQPVQSKTLLTHIADILSPLTPKMETFLEYTLHNKSLDLIQRMGFVPDDAIRERLPWSSLTRTYAPDTLLKFGFTWEHMVKMGIRPADVSRFSWTQQIHSLQLNATKLLQMHMTISELAALQYSTHQLLELDFDWATLTNMGGNVETWSLFRFELADLKRYWKPTMSQWVAGGFYDKGRLQRAGWVIETVLETLPTMTQRCSGRTLRLAF